MTTTSLTTGLDEEQLLAVLTALKNGDFTARMPTGATGIAGRIAETVNALQDQSRAYASETNRINHEIGIEGIFGGQAEVPGVSGAWKEMVDNLNIMSSALTAQMRNLSRVTNALVAGDTSRKVTAIVGGETEEFKDALNTLVEQHTSRKQPGPGFAVYMLSIP